MLLIKSLNSPLSRLGLPISVIGMLLWIVSFIGYLYSSWWGSLGNAIIRFVDNSFSYRSDWYYTSGRFGLYMFVIGALFMATSHKYFKMLAGWVINGK